MKIVFGNTFLKQAEKYGVTIDDLEYRITHHFHSCISLASPFPDTNVYKGYYSGTTRVIMFYKSKNGLLYPVYFGDKGDPITKNITGEIIKKYAPEWFLTFQNDLINNAYRVRHIRN